jgi:hypothetical protein
MRVRPALLAIIGIGVARQAGLVAQTTDDLVTRAVRAYGDVELDAAVGYLRRWFASDAATRAPLDQRHLALTYLGAAETLRGNPDSAASAFERLVELDPRARIDELTFPPEVTTRFNAVRARTKVVSIDVAPVTEIRTEGERFVASLYASSPHQLRVVLRRQEGNPVRVIYTGLIGDSLAVRWDGRDSSGAWPGPGRYFLEAFSTANGRDPQRVLQVPLEVAVDAADTLPAPPPLPDSLLLLERRGAGAGVEALLGGLVAGLGVVVLPPLLMPEAEAKPLRFAIAGTIGLAGLAGFLRDLPGGTIEANRRANDELRRDWQARAVARQEENRTRRTRASIAIRAGQPVVVRLAAP